ncbi:Prp18-domain-containing protein [Cylindrobasidium torrendii FP15055 ss-10]|uniref:Pre-mRNA-splicing factor 18 n=1 Tax=Cylindrobasidium torrendii FP15055 ss-10 TaxID=1314674 RepID=A0A0D7BGQ4_9AGAR|nr:Prp18-domain-containing protein [Cylindrobasidium torrendii FP15055 ss-10]
MDGLLAEVEKKRKARDAAAGDRPTKYMRRADIERLAEERERAEKEAREAALLAEKEAEEARRREAKEKAANARLAHSNSPAPARDAESPKPEGAYSVPIEETIRRLRAKGQPIMLFGETDKDRRLRLRALDLIEEKGHDRQGGQNDFKKALEDVENVERELHGGQPKAVKGKKPKNASDVADTVLDLSLVKSDPDKLYPVIYYALKRVLKEWGEAMDERPDSIKSTHQGKLAAATQVQSAEYLKPLFKQLRSRSLPADVLGRMAEIVHHMQKRQYQKANDAYLRLSIGNAPWPIGVTMVGIHERSAREKISSDQVAHVLNDEVSRKYIQSLKRLLTFSQTKYPPEDVSQLMG